MTTIRSLLLLLASLPMLGAAGQYPIQSQCRVGMYLPPTLGTPHDDAQEIALMPETTTTFRLCYDTAKGDLCGNATFATGGSSGQSVTGDTRGEFQLTSLTPATKYHWRVECLQDGGWKPGWDGSFVTTPSSGGEVRLVVSTDNHYDYLFIEGTYPDREKQARAGIGLVAENDDFHGHIDLGDGLFFQCNTCGATKSDDFGRPLGIGSIDSYATNEAEAIAFGEARASLYMRRWWRAYRFLPPIIVRGNHDVGGQFGDNGYGYNLNSLGHHQYREITPWVETGISISLPGDLASNGIFSETGHGMSDGDGPYRWAPIGSETYTDMPGLSSCSGSRSSSDYPNEWYVDYVDANTFRLSYNDTDAGCTSVLDYGSGNWTLVRGSNMRHTTAEVRDKYLPNHNEVLAHGWGPAEKGIMGPIRLSDYIVVLHLDEYEYTPETGPGYFPAGNRLDGPNGGWTLGSQQRAGALALINDLGPGSVGGYEDVEILIIVMHHTLGGHDVVGMPYGRGTLCEVDTRCMDDSSVECDEDSQCSAGGGLCNYPVCTDDFAHDGWQNIHDAADAFVTRASGVALVAVGHDHQCSGGKKDGVFYYTAGPLNAGAGGWISGQDHMRRYDFDGDGWPAYYKSLGKYGYGANFSGKQNFPTEWGSDLAGISKLVMCPSSGVDACASGKPEIQLDYIVNAIGTSWPELHGVTEFSVVLQGP